MGITTNGLSVIAANMVGSALATSIAIGTGSAAFASGNTTLDNETDRNQINTSSLGIAKEVTFIANWNPLEISGTVLKEYGVMTLGSTMINREVLAGSLVFAGEEELQIQQTYSFFT